MAGWLIQLSEVRWQTVPDSRPSCTEGSVDTVICVVLDSYYWVLFTSRTQHVRRVERVEMIASSCAVRQAQHSQNARVSEWVEFNAPLDTIQVISKAGNARAWHVKRVESCRNEPSGIWAILVDVCLVLASIVHQNSRPFPSRTQSEFNLFILQAIQ